MATDTELLEEYNKEIHGIHAKYDKLTLTKLIESHRHLRQKNREWNEVFNEARVKGYNAGYEWGVKNAAANCITLDELRKMTIQDLANLIGTDKEND